MQLTIPHSLAAVCCQTTVEMARDRRVCSYEGRLDFLIVGCVRTFSPLEAVTTLPPLSTATSLQVRSDQDSFRPSPSRGAEPPGSSPCVLVSATSPPRPHPLPPRASAGLAPASRPRHNPNLNPNLASPPELHVSHPKQRLSSAATLTYTLRAEARTCDLWTSTTVGLWNPRRRPPRPSG